jgi:hypothetical protein
VHPHSVNLSTQAKRPISLFLSGSPGFVAQSKDIALTHPDWAVEVVDFTRTRSRILQSVLLTRALRRADLWYQIGGYFSAKHEMAYRLALGLGVPVTIQWLGADVLLAKRHFKPGCRRTRLAQRMTHLAVAPWLADELRTLGVNATFLPRTSRTRREFLQSEPPALREQFTVVTYIVEEQPDLYGWQHIRRLAMEFPDIEVLVSRAEGKFASDAPGNVKFLGWVSDVRDVYARATVAVRMTTHDGYAGSIQEPLLLGRYAIWTYPFPGVLVARDYDELRSHIVELRGRHRSGALSLNLAGRDYIRRHMDPDALILRLRAELEGRLHSSTATIKRQ